MQDPEDRLRRFAEELDAIYARVAAKLGKEDVEYVRRIRGLSRGMGIAGRTLIHFSLEPISFAVGVIALAIHRELEAAEIGHTALHGTFDRLEGAEAFRSDSFVWEIPIDEESWRHGHNVRHHGYTNVAGKDPDIHFGFLRFTEHTARRMAMLTLPFELAFSAANFSGAINVHCTGLIDVYFGNGRPEGFDFIPDRSWRTILETHRKALRKSVPYYAKNFILYPMLAGPFFPKVLLGNWLADLIRNVYLAATIFSGHIGDDVTSYEEDARAHGRGEWYAMQIEASHNFEVSWPISVLCGALDRQIEHHLFPRLPTNRLREISPEVRALCQEFGIKYNTDTWPRTLKKAMKRIVALRRPGASEPARQGARSRRVAAVGARAERASWKAAFQTWLPPRPRAGAHGPRDGDRVPKGSVSKRRRSLGWFFA